MVPQKSSAFVKFKTLDDVELAIKRNDKTSDMKIYRSSDEHMNSDQNKSNPDKRSQSSTHASLSMKSGSDAKTDDCNRTTKYLKVRGLPWSIDKSYIISLFPGMNIK